MIKNKFLLLFMVLIPLFSNWHIAKTQTPGTASEYCSSPSIRTILFFRQGWELSMPVLLMEEDQALELHFDDLSGDDRNYSYSIQNCNYNWLINNVSEYEFLDGFNDQPIYNSQPSRNTTQSFTHYSMLIPNEDLKITHSGNYIVRVYNSNNPEKTIFTRKFALVDEKVEINAWINKPGLTQQEVMMTINLENLDLDYPVEEVKVVVLKNYNWNNTLKIKQPPQLRSQVLHLDMPYQIVAEGGNEYRYFDTKSTKFLSERINNINFQPPYFNFYLEPDETRQFRPYFASKDLNGQYFVEIPDADNRHLDADYVKVHFQLNSEQALGTDVYIYGALTNWKTDTSNYMVYNPDIGAYERTLLLKQGMINYAYVTHDYNSSKINFDLTEGNHAETENEYFIFVYVSKTMEDLDELVGFTTLNSTDR